MWVIAVAKWAFSKSERLAVCIYGLKVIVAAV